MKLLTAEIVAQLEKSPLYSHEADAAKDVPVIVKFFTPWSNWTWYVTEGKREGTDWLFFGLVDGLERELGYFTLSELESVRGPAGLKIERDMHFGKHALADFLKEGK